MSRHQRRIPRPAWQSAKPEGKDITAPVDRDVTAEQIARINTLTATAKTSWFGMLSFLAFVGVTLMGVEDADFFIPERQTQLPLVGVSIPTFLFFWVAPGLAAALYAYFHMHLLKLWDALAAPPGKIGDQYLSEAISPWLVSDFALWFRKDDALRPRHLRGLALTVTWMLAFLAAPLMIAAFWLRSTPAHDEGMTLIGSALPLCIVLYVGRASWSAMWKRMRRIERQPFVLRSGMSLLGACLTISIVAVSWFRTEDSLADLSLKAMNTWNAVRLSYARHPFSAQGQGSARLVLEQTDNDAPLWNQVWRPFGSARQHNPLRLAQAQLADVDFVDILEDWRDYQTARTAFHLQWCKSKGISPGACGPASRFEELSDTAQVALNRARATWCAANLAAPAQPTEADAACQDHFADLLVTFTTEWDRERPVLRSQLTARSLRNRDLRQANLRRARMEGADLRGARMEGADLNGAQMEGANLFEAQMKRVQAGCDFREVVLGECQRTSLLGANLSQAQMDGADLGFARMDGANLRGTQFNAAILTEAQMSGVQAICEFISEFLGDCEAVGFSGANLSSAQMDGADLRGARMEGANLSEAQMKGADLRRAQMKGAKLREAQMERADPSEAQMEKADLSRAQMDGAKLREAQMEGADLSRAQMDGANLSEAQMKGADLSGAQMEGADLSGAQMEGAILSGAQMEGANLRGVRFDRRTDFTAAVVQYASVKSNDLTMVELDQDQVNAMFGDRSVTLPPGLDYPAHWLADGPRRSRSRPSHHFYDEWRAWQADPDGYVPPQDRP